MLSEDGQSQVVLFCSCDASYIMLMCDIVYIWKIVQPSMIPCGDDKNTKYLQNLAHISYLCRDTTTCTHFIDRINPLEGDMN